MKYYVTFKRPVGDYKYNLDLENKYIIMYAPTTDEGVITDEGIKLADKHCEGWKTIYTAGYGKFDTTGYPGGCVGTIGEKSPQDELDEIIENIYEQRRNNREIENARYNNGELLSKDQLCKE